MRAFVIPLTTSRDLACQPPSTLPRAANHALKSAPVAATQGSTAALLPPRGGRSRSGTPRSDVLRNETAIQRVLPMAARHAHEFECGERRRGTSQDRGLRRGAAFGTCWPRRQHPLRRVLRPRATADRAASSAAGVATNFATRDALAEAPRLAHRNAALRSGTFTPRTAPSATDKRAGRRRRSWDGGLGGGPKRRTARGGAGAGAVLGRIRRPILVPTSPCPESAADPASGGDSQCSHVPPI